MKVKKLFQEIIRQLENGEIYFAGDGREFFLFNGKYQIKIGELEMEFKNHNGYEGEDWNREFKEQLVQEDRKILSENNQPQWQKKDQVPQELNQGVASAATESVKGKCKNCGNNCRQLDSYGECQKLRLCVTERNKKWEVYLNLPSQENTTAFKEWIKEICCNHRNPKHWHCSAMACQEIRRK